MIIWGDWFYEDTCKQYFISIYVDLVVISVGTFPPFLFKGIMIIWALFKGRDKKASVLEPSHSPLPILVNTVFFESSTPSLLCAVCGCFHTTLTKQSNRTEIESVLYWVLEPINCYTWNSRVKVHYKMNRLTKFIISFKISFYSIKTSH